jgi:predicted nucleic acid-binding Zn ribbon protein
MEEKKVCEECGEPILGRSDKKFCSDQCRNTFNNRLNSDTNAVVRNLSNILRKNRRILQALAPEGKQRVSKDKMVEMGYNVKFHTHEYKTQKGDLYHYCFEYGFLTTDESYCFVVIDGKLS